MSPSCVTRQDAVSPDDEQLSESDADTLTVTVLDEVVLPFAGTYRYASVPSLMDVIFVPDEFLISAPDKPDTEIEYDLLSVYVVVPVSYMVPSEFHFLFIVYVLPSVIDTPLFSLADVVDCDGVNVVV